LRTKARFYWFFIADFVAASWAWVVFFIFRKRVLNEELLNSTEYTKLLVSAVAIASMWMLLYYLFGFYHNVYKKSRIKEFFNMVYVTFWGCIIVFFALFLDDNILNDYHNYYKTFFLYFSLHFGIGVFIKTITISRIKVLIKQKAIFFNCLLVGGIEKVTKAISELEKASHILGLNFIGYVSPYENEPTDPNKELRFWGSTDSILKVIRRCNVDRIVICIDPTEHLRIKELTNLLAGSGTKVSVMPDLYQIIIGSVKVEHVLGVPLIDIDHDLMPFWQTVLKRWIDIFFSAIVMLLGFPFFLLFMCLTKFTSQGAIFFIQERVGINGKLFKMIKFRSMYLDAETEGPALSSDNDPRITKWGKFMRKTRIDELPQFFNVFKGDMSLVGPRPERQFFIDQIIQYAPEYRHLHKIRPGITSLGQVKYGYAENIDQMLERLKYDLLYIENMSIANDFRILYFTVLTVLGGKGK
jgi:exopolysaccharide biosynthesis polyprenyl glycosylphosphotransferase